MFVWLLQNSKPSMDILSPLMLIFPTCFQTIKQMCNNIIFHVYGLLIHFRTNIYSLLALTLVSTSFWRKHLALLVPNAPTTCTSLS